MRAFTRYAWFVVFYNVLVILWGAVVRATGSGAGCGRHWPTCNGEVIPRAESVETLIELSHRITSTIAGFLVIALVVWAYRAFTRGTLVRRAAVLSLIFIIIEGALGAGLVLLELVENNASVWRAIAVSVHLLNTFVLLLWLVLTAWASRQPQGHATLRRSAHSRLMTVALVGVALLSSAGAVTALGDTLFLSGALAEQLGEETAARHFLVQLRVVHPISAIFVSGLLLYLARHFIQTSPSVKVRRLSYAAMGIVIGQVVIGVFTIILRAPIVMQISHLLVADIMWITLLLLQFEIMTLTAAQTSASVSAGSSAQPA